MNLTPVILVFFFLSGLAGLIYEILWLRMIDKVMGSAPFAVATVLAVFMGGLALGSYLAGRSIDRIGRKRDLLSLFGKLETAVGLYGLLLPLLMVMVKPLFALAYRYLFQAFSIYSLFAFFVCALLLILPTSLMGATLPILCRYHVARTDHLGTRTGRLYGLNTLGAAMGAGLAGFYLVMTLGVWGTLFLAAGINLCVGLLSILFSRAPWADAAAVRDTGKKEAQDQGEASSREPPPAPAEPAAFWALWIFAVSGFCAMAYEVIWTRLLGLLIGPTTYSFTLVIATFIIGLAAGSLVFGWLADRVGKVFTLLVLTQAGAALLALMVSHLLGNSQFFFAKLIYTFRDSFPSMITVQSGLIFSAMLAPTLLLGATFPLVNKIYARSLSRMGRAIGTAYALNTIGAILGSLAAGFLLIPVLGKENALRTVIFLQMASALLAWLAVRLRAGPRPVAVILPLVLALSVVGLCLRFPSWNRQFLSFGRYHNFTPIEGDLVRTSWLHALRRGNQILARHETGREIVYYGDGAGGFTTVEKLTDSMGTVKYTLLNSGKPDASSHGDRSTQTLLAHVPMMFHPGPEKVMVLGLASGMTAGEVLHYPVRQLDVLEISAQVVRACAFFRPWNNKCLEDPRSRIILQDGRNHLSLTREAYDVIISEPSNPWMAGLANLYTLDFFKTVRRRLKEGGIFVQWIHSYEMDWPTFALVGRTFAQAFPRGALFTTLTGVGDYLLVGFKGEIGLDPDTAGRNLVHARESGNMVLPDYRLLYRLIITEDLERLFGPGPLHTDNRPRLEFAAPRQLHTSDASIEENLSQRGTLSARSRAVVRETEEAAARLDLLAFSASVGSPLFNAISPDELSPDHRHRYHRILDAYCSETAVEDYGLIPDSAASARCAEHQAAKIRSHLSRVPRDAAAHYSLGLALQQMGHNREALAAFEKAVSINPFHAPAYNNMGIAHVREADFEKAEAAFLKALSVNPAHANAHFNLARIALQQGEKDKAMARLRQGLQHEENPRARALLRELLLTE